MVVSHFRRDFRKSLKSPSLTWIPQELGTTEVSLLPSLQEHLCPAPEMVTLVPQHHYPRCYPWWVTVKKTKEAATSQPVSAEKVARFSCCPLIADLSPLSGMVLIHCSMSMQSTEGLLPCCMLWCNHSPADHSCTESSMSPWLCMGHARACNVAADAAVWSLTSSKHPPAESMVLFEYLAVANSSTSICAAKS